MTALSDGFSQALQPDAAPPPGQNRNDQSGNTAPPKRRGPCALIAQTEAGPYEETDNRAENNMRLH